MLLEQSESQIDKFIKNRSTIRMLENWYLRPRRSLGRNAYVYKMG